MHIKIREGLDIPIKGVASCLLPFETLQTTSVALNLQGLSGKKGLHLLVKEGDRVLLGSSVAEDKAFADSKLVAPAAGYVKALVRGPKRSLESIIIACEGDEAKNESPLTPESLSREALLLELQRRGLFNHIRKRPFNVVAIPTQTPRSIFVKALESAPFLPQPDLQIEADPHAFQAGLDFLGKLTDGPIHLIHRSQATKAILQAKNVNHTTIEGPHPSAHPSVHIHHLDPIEDLRGCVWTLSAWDVLVIGKTLTTGCYFSERIVALAGEGIVESKRRFVRTVAGASIQELIAGCVADPQARIISGDPLMGQSRGTGQQPYGYLNRSDTCLCALPSNDRRQFLHFLRLGFDKYTATGVYASNHVSSKLHTFTTSRHGEERAFIDAEPYQRVMPMQVPVMHLVKAVLADDFDTSQSLGLLEVDAEDFALPCFVCPSKIEMVDIIAQALQRWAIEMQ